MVLLEQISIKGKFDSKPKSISASNFCFFHSTNMQSQQYPVQNTVQLSHGQQAQQPPQPVMSQVGVPSFHQPYGPNSYPTQSISATNGETIPQNPQDPSVQQGSVVNLL